MRKLRADVQCPLVPPVTANLLDPWLRKHIIAQTKVVLEQHRVAASDRRRNGWHIWLAEQAAAGNWKTFAWIRQEEVAWAPSGTSKAEQLELADAGWWQLCGSGKAMTSTLPTDRRPEARPKRQGMQETQPDVGPIS